jgi:hypothetical protein
VYTCVTNHVDSSLTDLYTDYWFPSPVNLALIRLTRHNTLAIQLCPVSSVWWFKTNLCFNTHNYWCLLYCRALASFIFCSTTLCGKKSRSWDTHFCDNGHSKVFFLTMNSDQGKSLTLSSVNRQNPLWKWNPPKSNQEEPLFFFCSTGTCNCYWMMMLKKYIHKHECIHPLYLTHMFVSAYVLGKQFNYQKENEKL